MPVHIQVWYEFWLGGCGGIASARVDTSLDTESE